MTTTREKRARDQVVRIKGDILSTHAKELSGTFGYALEEAARKDVRELTVDLTSARMVDSTGLNVLMTLVRGAREGGIPVRVIITSPAVRRVFEVSRLDQVVEVDFRERKKRNA